VWVGVGVRVQERKTTVRDALKDEARVRVEPCFPAHDAPLWHGARSPLTHRAGKAAAARSAASRQPKAGRDRLAGGGDGGEREAAALARRTGRAYPGCGQGGGRAGG